MSNAADKARRSARQNFRIGLLAIGLSLLALYFAFAGLPFQGGYEISAIVPRASQIHANSPVRIAGVNVGKVTEVGRGPGNTAKITMALQDRGLPVHEDATLKIRPRLFLEGNFFVDLRPGTPSAPDLEEGATLPITQTAVPVQFDELLTALKSDTRADLKTVLDQYAAALDDGGAEAIRRSFGPSAGAFKGLARVAEESQGLTRDDVSRFIADNAKVTTALAGRRGALRDLIANFDRTIGAFAAEAGAVRDGTREFAGLVDEARPALGEVNAALPSLRRLARDLRPLARRSPRTLDLALPLLRQLRGLVSAKELPPLLRDARPTLRVLAAAEPRLTGLLDQVAPISECVATRVLPVGNSVIDDGHLTSGLKVWQELLTSTVGLASAAQNFDGNGPITHLSAGAGDQTIATGAFPGVGQLVGTGEHPLIGSRPAPPKQRPPFRPDVPCLSQAAPKLRAAFRAAPAPPAGVRPARIDRAQARRTLDALRRGAKEGR
jgi:virulence factor Mce-like protein